MNGEEIKNIINLIPSINNLFKGVFSINTLPKQLTVPSFLICNFDLDIQPGSHWFCLLKTAKSQLECFDSLGINKDKEELLQKYCKIQYISSINFNETRVQNLNTSTCGKFAIFFAVQRLHNLDLTFSETLNEIFFKNDSLNERKVRNFFKNIKYE